jgi:nucleotide-binding universal stress UspA family protein
LLHAYATAPVTSSFVDVGTYIKEAIEPQLNAQAQQAETALHGGAILETKIIWKTIAEAIKDITKKESFDIIVMGTKGASGWSDFLGTHTSAVLKNTNLPILVVPHGFAYRPIQMMVLAVDEVEKFDEITLAPLVKIAKNYQALVRIYHKDETKDGLNTAIDAYLQGLERTYYYEINIENLHESLHTFAKEHNADMLCMIRRKRDFLESIFHESATFSEAMRPPLPLLLLQE